ncbi:MULTISPECIES: alpha/beta hydrolase [Nocardia]|uniref:alpha/beta hydrolase n=1 Tax=Nocardia TaxID=1817 RepID=UPI001E4AF0F2|nr:MULTISPECIES: alpha/beta-hydrolase family protein [Nocardia]
MDSGPSVRNAPTEPESEVARPPRDPHGLSFTGMVLALLVAWISLTPSLLPRGPLFQGIVSGAAAFVGYGLGTLLAAVAFWMVRRRPPRPGGAVWMGLAVLAVAGSVGVFLWFAHWQRDLRTLMEVDGLSWRAYPTIVIVAVIIFAALLLTARAVVWVARAIAGVLGRVLPDRVAVVAACLVVVVGAVGILNGVVADAGMTLLNDVFKNVNNEIGAEIDAPQGPERSGGPGSLVSWESLGRQGRIFVAGGPTAAQLATFSGRPASTPVRVYTGLASAPTPEEEAALAVAELERAGGFQRAVLGVATTTGTGWINERTAAAVEYLYNGDTALVSMQYSYLPSWISFVVDKERARRAGRALFDAVYARWSTLAMDARPKLVVFGESLGSFGGEAAFSGVQDMAARTDGVLFVGPTASNEVWRDVTARRDSGSPEWLPIYRDGRIVRFVARAPDLGRPASEWPSPRVVYLQHASDPITWWTPELLFREPDWLREPRGDDVLPATRWYPVVTFLQVSADMAVSVDVPDGHGHTFHAAIADSWAAILAPAGWSEADTTRLRAVLTGSA